MNIAYRFRIYPTEEQKILLGKTFGCCRFLYNQMLNDKIREYKKTKKLLKNTPAMYKKEYPFLKEVDSLALANVQLHLEKAYKNFFRDPKAGFPRFKSKHHSQNSYTTNVVNGNILVEDIDMKAMSQCLHFGKSVQDNGYGMFRNMLDYKLAWKGKKLVKIDRFFPSSKKCSKCGKIKKELKLSERVYRCMCGNEMDRDRNAAINIREEARRMLTA
ncbi:hypothetical protein DW884_02800 [Ruminococcus sp. AM40-10AC]|nr:hypothetical protein DW884_02800 [Ruminococcus sp. AM40-10AC]RHT70220.1 hypothetical protein DW759_06545 [Ruminococcus sp. AM29-12LB]